jgi:hypothetical protein
VKRVQILTKLLHIAAWVFAVIAIVSLFFNRNQRLVLHYYVRIIAIVLLTVSTGALLLHLFT